MSVSDHKTGCATWKCDCKSIPGEGRARATDEHCDCGEADLALARAVVEAAREFLLSGRRDFVGLAHNMGLMERAIAAYDAHKAKRDA